MDSAFFRIIFTLLIVACSSNLFGQITGSSAVFQSITNYDGGEPNDEIFVFCGANSGELSAKSVDATSGWAFTWNRWDATSGTFSIPVTSSDTPSESVIASLSDGLYQVVLTKTGESDQIYEAWVINRISSSLKPILSLDKQDCAGVFLKASFQDLLQYQDIVTKESKNVSEDITFEYNRTGLDDVILRTTYPAYSGEEKSLIDESVFEGEEEYTLTVMDRCGNIYTADPVLSGTIVISAEFTTTPDEDRKIDDGYEAPVSVDFVVNQETNIDDYEWFIYKDDGGNPEDLNEEDLVENGEVSNVSNFEFEFLHPGKYFVRLKATSASCEDQFIDLEGITVVESLVDVANYFIPSKHGKWIVKTQSLKSFKGIIFNRWGRVLYEWRNADDSWDGKVNGKMATPGTYFYVITAVGLEEETKTYTKKGSFMLIRKKLNT